MHRSTARSRAGFRLLGLAPIALLALAPTATAAPPSRETLVQTLGVPRGIVAIVGDAAVDRALDLAQTTEFLCYVQVPNRTAAESARRRLAETGLGGTRIVVDAGPSSHIHLATHTADALIALGPVPDLTEAEALRVIRPGGHAWLDAGETTKPALAGADDWSHPYHGADNNPLSRDHHIHAPYLTQFLADPRYAPLPQVAVAAGGRVFKAFGHIAFKEREEPLLNTLAAYNGYNGTLLWSREIPPAIMVHRSTLVATTDRLYYGDDRSCKVYDAASGTLRDDIVLPDGIADGTFWKWLALENNTLFALIGEQEQRDPVIKLRWDKHGWPWNPLSPGYNQPEHTWGYGRTLVAVDPASKKILWHHREAAPVDSRALCLKGDRLYAYRHGAYLVCVDTRTGKELWRKTPENAPELFQALGPYLDRQDWRTNWRTTAYLKCSDDALYFAGPSIGHLVAASTRDGRLLWQHPYGNYQLILRPDAVYGISGQIDTELSRTFHPLTGQILAELKLGRRACTRPTACDEAIFFRADEGSVRLDTASNRPQLVSPMRAQCHDGVTVANGLLYWWPSSCDCNLSLYGITCLGPAGDFAFSPKATDADRLETVDSRPAADLAPTPADWPMYRGNEAADTVSVSPIPNNLGLLWETKPAHPFVPTAPTAAANYVYLAGEDGAVRALRAEDGQPAWTAFTGGAVRYPPTLANGRAYVGSGDGWIYCYDATAGRLLWRFRAAPAERRIPVYGQLISTWPVASGVLVHDGVAFAAAGIVNYDGTHVFALDAASGRLKWQNSVAGHLDPEAHTGVSVQGHLMWFNQTLYLAGGNAVSPGMFDPNTGECRNDRKALERTANNNVPSATAPRGSELYRLGQRVMVSDKPLYAHPRYPVLDSSVLQHTLVASTPERDYLWVNNAKVLCVPRITDQRDDRLMTLWRRGQAPDIKPLWETACESSRAFALCPNAVLIATTNQLVALNPADGSRLSTQPLPGPPVNWGLAIDRHGRVLVTLENGQVLAFGRAATVAALLPTPAP